MTQEQQRVLLHKHLTGNFPGQNWATVEALFRGGFIAEDGKRIVVTPKGKSFCDAHHLEIPAVQS